MDIIAVFSVCPAEDNECNDFKAKALRVQVLEWEEGVAPMECSNDVTRPV